jgi:competence protein ComEC
VAAVLLCAAASTASAVLHGADVRRGPVPALAARYAEVTAELEVSSDPRLTRPRVTGDHVAPTSVVIDARVLRVTTADGTETSTRTPVLLIADAIPPTSRGPDGSPSTGRPPAPGPGTGSPWQALLPSTRLRVQARLAPPLADSGQIAAVLRVSRGAAPHVVRAPSGLQCFAGELRAGLREATDELPPDARALLPGLVVGDTSRVPADLHDAFRATDLTHLLAVSGANFTQTGGLRSGILVASELGTRL